MTCHGRVVVHTVLYLVAHPFLLQQRKKVAAMTVLRARKIFVCLLLCKEFKAEPSPRSFRSRRFNTDRSQTHILKMDVYVLNAACQIVRSYAPLNFLYPGYNPVTYFISRVLRMCKTK